MKEELKESLEQIKTHPTTGTAHNAQLITTQVETIFLLDDLKDEIKRLTKTIEEAEIQNQKLEASNYNLQKAMFVLTAITTAIAVYPLLSLIIALINKHLELSFPAIVITALSLLSSLFTGLLTYKKVTVLTEKINLNDQFIAVLKNKYGNFKRSKKK